MGGAGPGALLIQEEAGSYPSENVRLGQGNGFRKTPLVVVWDQRGGGESGPDAKVEQDYGGRGNHALLAPSHGPHCHQNKAQIQVAFAFPDYILQYSLPQPLGPAGLILSAYGH